MADAFSFSQLMALAPPTQDRWANMPSSQNIEDRRNEAPYSWANLGLDWRLNGGVPSIAELRSGRGLDRLLSSADALKQSPNQLSHGPYDQDMNMAALRAKLSTYSPFVPDL